MSETLLYLLSPAKLRYHHTLAICGKMNRSTGAGYVAHVKKACEFAQVPTSWFPPGVRAQRSAQGLTTGGSSGPASGTVPPP